LQDLEALPIKLDLLTEVSQLPRELFDSSRQAQGKAVFYELKPLWRQFEN
jgi:hypothetical protein